MKTKKLQFDFDIKSLEEGGKFSGYLAVFGNIDSHGDRITKGAFSNSLRELKNSKRKLPILWQHNPSEPIGVFESLSEDEKGLFVEGYLLVEVPRAAHAHALMKAGAISGMSIGFSTVKSKTAKDGANELNEVKLWEGSIVTFPANDQSRISAVKNILDDGNLPNLPEFEDFLREAGFSKSQATAIAGGGLAKLLRSESDSADANSQVTKALQIFTQ